ncbi:DUF3987 domain-containing protein [Plastoroseomonas hellenica]|uniref:DUF3987 domain-containing protein n=1 Tax=Plastoroseomonas hellenica TaxID=2687306 RepID=UPI001BA9C0BE|nr:DUF3987 domain-containing protein [Plastoroseomonas hellenica]MBR0642926.1 DUF3987 domain-containing protein [Plastoroseomonas hellenica]
MTDAGNHTAPKSVSVTFFEDYAANRKREQTLSFAELERLIRETTAPEKSRLPWLKLARFGAKRTSKASLRHDTNVLAITGVEADYDGEEIPFDEAAERVAKAGLLSIVYTSPSHTEDTPRWRVLCPLSTELPPAKREHLMGRLNGLFEGIFSGESWTLSQSYYFGSVGSNPSHQVVLLDGTPLDALHELDEIWVGKPDTGTFTTRSDGSLASGPVDEPALLAQMAAGENYHQASIRLLGRWAREGESFMGARARLVEGMEAVPDVERDDRWHARRADIDRCLEWVFGREAAARDAGRPTRSRKRAPPPPEEEEPWPSPVDFLAEGELTGLPELRREHLPAAIYDFALDTADRMGVDPSSVALAALVTCASAMQESWRIQPKQHDDSWTEEARLWGAIVGDPSVLKSPVIAACTRPIERLDAQARRVHAEAMRQHKADVEAWKKAGSEPGSSPQAPLLDRHLVEGTTVEALSEILRDDAEAKQRAATGRVLIRQDEMSEWLASFDRYRSGGRGGADRGAYLRLYNGGRYVVDRVQRGTVSISSWSACIIGGIQPEPIQRIASEAADDGLLQRFLYCVPGPPKAGVDRPPDRAARKRYERVIAALVALHPPRRPGHLGQLDSIGSFQHVALHADAHRHRLSIDGLIDAVTALPDISNRLKAALGKWRGLFARLCLAFHLIDAVDLSARDATDPPPLTVLSETNAQRVALFMRQVLLPHLLRAEALMFSTSQTGHTRWIAGLILARGGERIALRDVVQAYGALRPPEARRELHNVMECLVSMAWLRPEPQANPARPPAAWSINPAVHSEFAARAKDERAARQTTREEIRVRLLALTKGES